MEVWLDKDPVNADWTKRTAWDLPINNIVELRQYLIAFGYSVEHFKSLPVYAVNQYLHPWLEHIPDDLLTPGWKPPTALEPAAAAQEPAGKTGKRGQTVTVRGARKPPDAG